jgi:hypothetical protein
VFNAFEIGHKRANMDGMSMLEISSFSLSLARIMRQLSLVIANNQQYVIFDLFMLLVCLRFNSQKDPVFDRRLHVREMTSLISFGSSIFQMHGVLVKSALIDATCSRSLDSFPASIDPRE